MSRMQIYSRSLLILRQTFVGFLSNILSFIFFFFVLFPVVTEQQADSDKHCVSCAHTSDLLSKRISIFLRDRACVMAATVGVHE